MAPKNERQKCNRNPAYCLVFSAASKKKEKEGTAEKDRAPKWIKTEIRKTGIIAEALKYHLVNVPGNRVQRKQSMFVPRFVSHIRDMEVTEIEDGMKPQKIISARQQRQSYRKG